MKKECNKCKISKELKDFPRHKTGKYGREGICKLCKSNYYKNNKEKIKLQQKKYDTLNSRKEYRKKYREKTKQKTADRSRTRYNNEIEYRLKSITRVRIYNALKGSKSKHTIDYLGCSIKKYKKYIESMFTPEMNWENYGSYWEIDHKIPLAKGGSFHYTNTQPLTISENRIKHVNL